MKNGDYIRAMDDDRMARFLFNWSINTVTSFLEHGGMKIMNALELRKWMESEEFLTEETKVHEGFAYDSDFNLKKAGADNG